MVRQSLAARLTGPFGPFNNTILCLLHIQWLLCESILSQQSVSIAVVHNGSTEKEEKNSSCFFKEILNSSCYWCYCLTLGICRLCACQTRLSSMRRPHSHCVAGEDRVCPSEAGYKSSYSVPVFLDADEVQARGAGGVQDQEDGCEDVTMLLGAWQQSQEDERLGDPDEEVEPGGDQIPPGPGCLGCAAQPNLPLVLVLPEAEYVTVEERGEEAQTVESKDAAQSEGVEEGQVEGDAATRTPWLASAFVVEGEPLLVEEDGAGEADHKGGHGAGQEAEEGLPLVGG